MIVSSETRWSSEQAAALEALAGRVAGSPQLHSSPKLREFFLYVIDCALRQAPEEATEQQIGVHVFHRQPGYNSGDDSIVRSQARLLRAKVAAYFANEGSDEEIVIEIPKGQYFPVFRSAGETPDAEKAQTAEELAPAEVKAASQAAEHGTVSDGGTRAGVRVRRLIYAALAAIVVLAAGICVGYLWKSHAEHPATPVLDVFWKPFYSSNNALVIYSNPTFVGDPTNGLRLAIPKADGSASTFPQGQVDETYTGTGEAEAIHTLTSMFDAHSARFTLKRSKLVTWDEARSRSLIFVGAPSQNTALNALQTLTQFYIAEDADHRGFIVNTHPRSNEPGAFPRQSATQETAIVALLPGLRPDTRTAIFCGLSTVGTQEAVEFLSQPESIRTLMDTVGTEGGVLKPFEAVLRIDTSDGVAMDASFLSIHKR